MARERFAFLRTVESILKGVRSWIGGILRREVYRRVLALSLLSLFLTVGMPPVLSQVPALKPTLLAQDSAPSLVQQSQEKYENGDFAGAIELLRQAVRLFEEGESRNRAITLVNLGRIQSELGQQYQACETLTQALGLSSGVCEDEELPENRLEWVSEPLRRPDLVQVNSLRIFGDVLRAIGRLEESQQILEQSVKLVENLSSSKQAEARGAILLSLGNTLRARGNLERDRRASPQYDFIPWDCSNRIILEDASEAVKEPFDNAEQRYQQIIDEYTLSAIKTRAQLNQLSLLLEQGKLNRAKELASTVNERSLSQFPQSRMRVYARINWAKSLACLRQKSPGDEPSWDTIVSQMKTAQREATEIKDKLAQSYVIGSLGGLHEYWVRQKQMPTGENPIQTAQKLTQEALYLVQLAEAANIAYQWQWQLGRLLEVQDKREEAITAYEAAVKTLESVRGDLLTINSDIQFSFRDNVEPVYRELVELLLRPDKKSEYKKNIEEKPKPKSEDIKKAIQNIDTLQLAELENFFRCNLVKPEQIDQVSDPKTAVIYPVILKNRLAIIFQLLGQDQSLTYTETSYAENNITRKQVEETLNKLRDDLAEPDRNPEVIRQSKAVYQWLIKPIEEVLNKNNQVETLVFVSDVLLRNIPIAALYNGQEYLVQRYAIATAPRLKIFLPKASRQRLSFLIGGVGIKQDIDDTEFKEIKKLNEELKQISGEFTTSKPLLNEDFTLDNIQRQLQSGKFSAIHWKTHGEFSSDPENTYIVAYQTLIKAKELSNLIQASRQIRGEPLELLVLSACSTAQGDNRAVLGLAGIAARAGVRSVLSTLWLAEDAPNTEFMTRFYEKLSEQGVTKAQAVRDTQRDLISEGRYDIPYYWANYVLVGNWL